MSSYTATVGAYSLDPVDVSVRLDASQAPHVTANLRVKRPTVTAAYEALDPRNANRVVLTRDGRAFDLSVRERFITLEDTVDLVLASDEAILMSHKAGADDRHPRTLEGSLRDIVDYVLDEVIPGTSLETTPTNDADLTAYWQLTNLMTNPSVANTDTGYTAGTNADLAERSTAYGHVGDSSLRWTADASGEATLHCRSFPVSENRSYVMRTWITTVAGRSVRMLARFRDPDGEIIQDIYNDPITATGQPTFDAVSQIVTAPEGASNLSFNVLFTATAGGQACYADAFMLYEGDELVDFFMGSSSTTGYTNSWADTAHASTSTRVPTTERDPESTVWRAGVSAMEFLLPLFQAAGLRLVCDEDRKWTLRDEDYTASGSLSAVYGANLRSGSERISLDSGLYMDARLTKYRWDRNGKDYTQEDYYELTDPPQVVGYLEIDAPYPGPGRSEYAVRRAQTRGREVEIVVKTDMDTSAEQHVNVTLQDMVLQIGTAQTVDFRWAQTVDEMRILTRTREIPPGSVETLTGTVDDLSGTVDDL